MSRFLLILSLVLLTSPVNADKPILALVIDDLGYSFEQAKKVINLPGQHTYAIIPHTTFSKRIALYAHQNGRETILHMSMQSTAGRKNETSALHDGMSEAEITDTVLAMIQQVPHAKGVNNHMGSRLTEIGYMMRPVMETIKNLNHNFYFLDSRTTALSKAYQQARQAGLAALKRDVFLDANHVNPEAIIFQYRRWLNKAKDRGQAIAISHPHPTTIEVLQEKLPQTFAEFDFLTLSQLIQFNQQETKSWPKYLSHWQQDSKNSKQ